MHQPGSPTASHPSARNVGRRRALRIVASVVAAAAVAVALAGCVTGPASGPRRPGPYDPGTSELPPSETIIANCGSRVDSSLYTLSDRYTDIADEWNRLGAYLDAVTGDGTTADEAEGARERLRRLDYALDDYAAAADNVRSAAASISGPTAAACDRDVVAVFERIFEARTVEIDYVRRESNRRVNKLG